MNRKLLYLLSGVILVALVIGGIVIGKGMLRQPTATDFTHLNNQRAILNESFEVYRPYIDNYSSELANAFREDRPQEELSTIQDRAKDQLEDDREINEARLVRMESSPALKNKEVKDAFTAYADQQRRAIDYYEQVLAHETAAARAITGSCSKLSKLNVGVKSYPADYVKEADVCLASLKSAKNGTSGPTKELLGSVESMIQKRRDTFKQSADASGDEAEAKKISGLLLQLQVNGLLEGYIKTYQTGIKKSQDEFAAKVKTVDSALEKAIKDARGTTETAAR